MTETRNYRELSRKKKTLALTPKAWIIFGVTIFLSLMFIGEAKGMLLVILFSLILYIVLFIFERIDEDIFEILSINFFQNLGGTKFYA